MQTAPLHDSAVVSMPADLLYVPARAGLGFPFAFMLTTCFIFLDGLVIEAEGYVHD